MSIFKSKIPEIIILLNNIKTDLLDTQKNIEATIKLDKKVAEKIHSQRLLNAAVEDFGIAIWMKDLDSNFIYANKICCDVILKCSLKEAIAAKDSDFEKNSLAEACMAGDKRVLDTKKTQRFIEHGIHNNKHIFLDTIKSPLYFDKVLSGTMGSGKNITDIIPENIKEIHKKACFIEIPIDTVLCEETITKYLKDKICEKV